MKGCKEGRRHERKRLRGQVEISWQISKSKTEVVVANCLDVSVYGMLIECPSAIAAGTAVLANIPAARVSGSAVVRHCRQMGPWFRIGLVFDAALMIDETVPHVREALIEK